MKQYISIIILILMQIPASICHAQVSIGNRAGLALFRQGFVAKGSSDLKQLTKNMQSGPGVSFGIPIEITINEHIAFQPELGYTTKGVVFDQPLRKQISRLNYADLSLLIKTAYGSDRLKLELFLGPGLAYGISQRYIGYDPPGYYYPNDYMRDFGEHHSSTELFITAGAGVTLQMGVPRLFLNYRYVRGITSIYPKPMVLTDINGALIDELSVFNRGSIISLGFMIPLARSAWCKEEAGNTGVN